MALSESSAVALAEELVGDLDRLLMRDQERGKIRRYLKGDQDLPYMPEGATTEFRTLAHRAITNWLPLISDTFAKALFVDGYRPAKDPENAEPWRYWQANGLDARQSIAHRGALEYGQSHVLVLPASPSPLIRPLPPTRTLAMYADPDDDFPEVGLVTDGAAVDGARLARLFDATTVYTIRKAKDESRWTFVRSDDHGLGVVPLVRFRDRLDGEAVGIISPLYQIQDRINETVFTLLIALQYASFRQRWATGLAIPVDEDPFLADGTTANPNFGRPVEAFEAAVNRLWVTDSTEAKFGDFSQTDTRGHLDAYGASVRTLAAIAQTPPHVLMGDLVNLSADALAAIESSTQRKVGEYETIFGESWEQVFRLAAAADGNVEAAQDQEAEVRWRDTEARSLASTVDALGKIAQMLQVPVEGLWERIPGVTDGDVERWRELRGQADGMALLASALERQAAPAAPADPTEEVPA